MRRGSSDCRRVDRPPHIAEAGPTRRPLRIVLLAHNSRVAGGLSVGKNMVASLSRRAPQHHYLVTIPRALGYEPICQQIPRCRLVYRPEGGIVRQLLFETFDLPKIVNAFQADVVVGLGNRGLLSPPCAQVIYIKESHYCYPLRHYGRERLFVALKYLLSKRLSQWQLRRTRLLLCQSRVMARRLRRSLRFRGPVILCPNSLSDFLLTGSPSAQMPEKLAPCAKQMRLLYVSRFYAHKNLDRIVEAFDRYRRELAGVVTVLTIDAGRRRRAAKFMHSIERKGLASRIINVGPVPQGELASYYGHCHGVLMPTLLESFSATYLEGMHFGVPILTSDLDFARGICGDAALYFDPWDAASMKDAILRLKASPALAEELVARGRVRLAMATKPWDEIASDVLVEVERLGYQKW